ncbi:MAG: DUF4340 domain-containing protein [Verrucomicrobiota bacterium]|jgi:hypothetical protein|nr:DUF4340 domain-containing protein [Verrucomicrobiota bacterium]
MNVRLTILLAFVAAALASLIFFWDRDEENLRNRIENARRAFRFDPARVERIVLETDHLTVECRLEGRRWMLTRPITARADPVAVEQLLGSLQDLSRGEIILPPRRTTTPYAPYGLEPPRARISLVEGSSTNQLLIGRRTPLGDGIYVRRSDHPDITRVPTTLLDLLPANANALRDRSLLSGDAAAINRFDIRNTFGYIQLIRSPSGAWQMIQPIATRADPAVMASLLDQILSTTIVQFVQDHVSDLVPYGLDSQSTVTIVLNSSTGEGSQMIAFGDPLPNTPELVYARLQAENSVYAVPGAIARALTLRPDDLRDRRIPGMEPDGIQRVFVSEGEKVLEFHRDTNEVWQLDLPLRTSANPEAIRQLLQSWSTLRLTAFETTPASNAPPFTRTLRIIPRDVNGQAVTLRIGPHPSNTNSVRILIGNDTTAAIATPAHLLSFPMGALSYQSRDVLSIPAEEVTRIHLATPERTLRIEREADQGPWIHPPEWLDAFLLALNPLQAETLLEPTVTTNTPLLTLRLTRNGPRAGSTVLTLSPPNIATIRGRPMAFTLSPATLKALLPPAWQPADGEAAATEEEQDDAAVFSLPDPFLIPD